MKCATTPGKEGMGDVNPAGSIPSVLGKQRMQRAEEISTFHYFILGSRIKEPLQWRPWAYWGIVLRQNYLRCVFFTHQAAFGAIAQLRDLGPSRASAFNGSRGVPEHRIEFSILLNP